MKIWGWGRFLGTGVFIAWALAPRVAHADELHGLRPLDLRVPFGFGLSGDSSLSVDFSAQPMLRYRFIEAGALYDAEAELSRKTSSLYAFAAGFVDQEPNGMRFELAGLLGAHHRSGIGCDLCKSGGAQATLPWAGARFDLSASFSRRKRAHFNFGFAVIGGRDLRDKNVGYTVTDDTLLGGETTTMGRELTGGWFVSGQVVVGGVFEI